MIPQLKVNVFVNYHKFSRFQNNTDISYAKAFKILEQYENSNIKVILNESKLSAYIADTASILQVKLRHFPWILEKLKIGKLLLFFSRNSLLLPFQTRNVDLIISFWYFPIVLFCFKKIPIIFCSGFTTDEFCGKPVSQRTEEINIHKHWFSKSDVITFPSTDWINNFNSIDSSAKDKIVFAPFIISDMHDISYQILMKKFDDLSKIKILFVARQGEGKGLFDLLDALVDVESSIKNNLTERLEITIITETLFENPTKLSVNHYSSIPHKEVIEKMCESHIFCLPTYRDSYGLVFIEAMGCGCAIIADKRIPRTEFFQNGQAGLLVKNDSRDIAKALKKLILEPAFAKNLASNALYRFQEIYSQKAAIKIYLKLVNDLLQKY